VVQAVPYAQDELVLLVPFNHELARRGSIDKCELYNLDFVSMNQGSSVQAAQEETLLQQGIKWHKLHTHMVTAPQPQTIYVHLPEAACQLLLELCGCLRVSCRACASLQLLQWAHLQSIMLAHGMQ